MWWANLYKQSFKILDCKWRMIRVRCHCVGGGKNTITPNSWAKGVGFYRLNSRWGTVDWCYGTPRRWWRNAHVKYNVGGYSRIINIRSCTSASTQCSRNISWRPQWSGRRLAYPCLSSSVYMLVHTFTKRNVFTTLLVHYFEMLLLIASFQKVNPMDPSFGIQGM